MDVAKLVGAITAIIGTVWLFRNWRLDRVDLRLEPFVGIPDKPREGWRDSELPKICIELVNYGRREVRVEGLGQKSALWGGADVSYSKDGTVNGLPCVVKEGERKVISIFLGEMNDTLKMYVTDSLNRRWYIRKRDVIELRRTVLSAIARWEARK